MQHNFNNPIYEISINSRECAISLKVNDMPCFSNFNSGGMAIDFPINSNILFSGKQSFVIEVFPYPNETVINTKAIVDIKISVRDGLDTSKPKKIISNFKTLDFSKQKENTPFYKIFHEFDAHVPYLHKGWIESINILNEKKENLMNEIDEFYDELHNIFKSSNVESYKFKTEERYYELCNSFYLNLFEMKRREVSFIPKFKGNIKRDNIEKYILNFYGNGRVVGINIPFEPVGLRFTSDNEQDNIIYEQALFHRKKLGEKLSLIR